MIMKIVFAALLCMGLLQIIMSVVRTKKIKEKIVSGNVYTSQHQNKESSWIHVVKESFSSKITSLQNCLIGKEKEFLARNVTVVTGAVSAGLYVNISFLNFDNGVVGCIVFFVAIYILYVQQRKKSRSQFEQDFAEALNIISSAVRVGRPVMQGFEECAKSINTDFGREFRRILQRLDIGDDPERVFMESYKLYPYSEYFSFVITVLINMKGGGQVSEVMSRLTALISASRTLERKKFAMTSEARMSVKVLAAIPVFFFFFLKFVSPDNFDILVNTDAGHYILYYVIGSILFGLMMVWSMMNKVG